jgi:membrane protease YdiL (CAAX protease family)
LAAAVVMAARENGKIGIRTLFRQLDPRRAPKRWFLIPLALVPLHLVPVAGYLAGGGTPPSSQALVGILLTFPVQVLLVAVMGGGLDEEMGWRGYALPKLLHITGPVTASIVLGMLWAPWHLPLWLDPTSSQAAYPFTVYLVKTVSLSVLIGWMYCASHGNLMVAIWAHALANSADGIRYQILGPDKGDPVHQLTVMVVLTAAAVVVGMATRGRLGADHLTNTHVHGPEPITAECRNPSNNPSTS